MKHYVMPLATLAVATLLATGCQMTPHTENHRDETFLAMVQDSTAKQRQAELRSDDGAYTVAFYADMEQPLLWTKGRDTVLQAMADFFNVCERANAIETDVDTYRRYWDEEDENDSLQAEMLECWRKITFRGISDPWARQRMLEARDVDTENNGKTEQKNIRDVFEKLTAWVAEYDSAYLADSIIPALKPQHYLPAHLAEAYDHIVGRDGQTGDSALVDSIYNAYRDERNLDTRMALMVMLLGGNTYDHGKETLIADAEAAFLSGDYSPMLPLLWRAYRIAHVRTYSCPSTFCDIDNLRFNYFRRLIGYTYLRHIEAHPTDDRAKLQFFHLAYRENINRFGAYFMGNQSAAEHFYLYRNDDVL